MRFSTTAASGRCFYCHPLCFSIPSRLPSVLYGSRLFFFFFYIFMMAEDSESAASQQSLELDDQDTCGIDGDNEEENEHMQG